MGKLSDELRASMDNYSMRFYWGNMRRADIVAAVAQLEQERDDARRWAKAWKGIAKFWRRWHEEGADYYIGEMKAWDKQRRKLRKLLREYLIEDGLEADVVDEVVADLWAEARVHGEEA